MEYIRHGRMIIICQEIGETKYIKILHYVKHLIKENLI